MPAGAYEQARLFHAHWSLPTAMLSQAGMWDDVEEFAPHLQQLVRAVGRPDAQLLEQLHQQAAKALECAGQPHLRMHLD